jgi:oxalate decarboxylase/phosphoglucose isomerase-like protein (cupin superfamily)
MLVKIEKASLFREDERGRTYDFSARESSYFIVLYRKKGTTSGNHYHKGKMESKSPEIFYLIKGEAELIARDIKTREEQVFDLEEGMKVETPPNIYHTVKAKTDIIILELLTDKEDFSNYDLDTVKN